MNYLNLGVPEPVRGMEISLVEEEGKMWDGEGGITGTCNSLKSPDLLYIVALRWLPAYH